MHKLIDASRQWWLGEIDWAFQFLQGFLFTFLYTFFISQGYCFQGQQSVHFHDFGKHAVVKHPAYCGWNAGLAPIAAASSLQAFPAPWPWDSLRRFGFSVWKTDSFTMKSRSLWSSVGHLWFFSSYATRRYRNLVFLSFQVIPVDCILLVKELYTTCKD